MSCFWPNPAAGEAGSCDYGPAAARGRQRALVRLRFSVWCIERHRHRRLVRKGTQAKVGPLSGTRAASRGDLGPGQKSPAFFDRQKHTPTEPSWVSENPSAFCLGGSGASRNWRKEPHVGGTWGLLRSPYFTLCCVRVATTHTHTHTKSGRVEKSSCSLLRHPHGRPPTVVEVVGEGCSWTLCAGELCR